MKESGNKSAKKFQDLVDEDGKDLSEDEKMALAAKKLEEKFRQENTTPKLSVSRLSLLVLLRSTTACHLSCSFAFTQLL
jgi:hypothetical protein